MGMALFSFSQNDFGSGKSYTTEVECLGVENDGSQTLRVWGVGRNKTDAIEQAKKNAVDEVLFKGIRNGTGQCDVKPIMLEVNAKEKYQYYFNVFYQDGGAFLQYVSMEDTRPLTNARENTKTQVKYCITVRVLRAELKQKLIDDKIIKP